MSAFLEGRPTAVRPVGKIVRLAKWARRSPASAALLAGTVSALLLFIATWGAFTNKLQKQRDELAGLADQLKTENEAAKENFARAHAAIKRYLEGFSSHTPLGSTRDLIFQQQMLEQGIEFYDELVGDQTDSERLRTSPVRFVEIQLERSRLYGEYAKILADFQEYDRAIEMLNHSIELIESTRGLAPEHPFSIERRIGVATATLAKVFLLAGETDRAEAAARRSIDCFQLAAQSSKLDVDSKNWYLAMAWARLGEILMHSSTHPDIEVTYRRAIDYANRLSKVDDYQLTRAQAFLGLGRYYDSTGQSDLALAALNQGRQVIRDVCQRSVHPLIRYPHYVRSRS